MTGFSSGVLMARVARKVDDRKILRLIRSYLEAGVMVGGIRQATVEGTPQGSPLSPVLSNVMLDDLDRELWERGHRFVRYADDLRVFVRSERAAQRVFESVCGVTGRRLKLKVNREKSSIRHAAQATLPGFGFFSGGPQVGIRIAPKAIARLKDQLRMLTRRRWSVSMDFRIGRLNRLITGWVAYFRLAQRVSVLGKLDGWLRRRLRQIRWKEWKTTAAKRHNLRIRGISESGVTCYLPPISWPRWPWRPLSTISTWWQATRGWPAHQDQGWLSPGRRLTAPSDNRFRLAGTTWITC